MRKESSKIFKQNLTFNYNTKAPPKCECLTIMGHLFLHVDGTITMPWLLQYLIFPSQKTYKLNTTEYACTLNDMSHVR